MGCTSLTGTAVAILLLTGSICSVFGQNRGNARPHPAMDEPPAKGESPLQEDSFVEQESLLEEIVVSKRRESNGDTTAQSDRTEGERLRTTGRYGLLEALSQQSGDLYVSSRGVFHGIAGGSSGGIRIRGLGGAPNTQVLVVEDQVPDFQGIFGHPIPDAYVSFLLDHATVVKGGDSVLYGTNAMGGVVVLHSRWREEPGYELSTDTAAGSFSTLRHTTAFLGRRGATDLSAAFHNMSSEGHRDGAGGELLVAQGAIRHRLGHRWSVALRNKILHMQGADPGPASHPHPDHWYDVWRNTVSMQWLWQGTAARLEVVPFANVGIHRLYDGFRSRDVVAGGKGELRLRLQPCLTLLVGLAVHHVDGRVEQRTSRESTHLEGMSDVAPYQQITWKPLSSLDVVLGAREMFSSTYGFVLLYKGGIRWMLPAGFSLQTRMARNMRQPTLRELYLPFPTANPDLRPEYSLNGDAGVGWKRGRVELQCAVFRTQATDMIRYFGSWPGAEVVNIDRIVIWGVEGRAEIRDLGPIRLQAAGGWQDVGRYTRQNPAAKLDLLAELRQRFGQRHELWMSVSGEWVHGLFMANYGRQPVQDVLFADLALRYRYSSLSRGFALHPYVIVRNVLDRDYAYVEGYPMPGLNVLLGLNLEI